MCLDSIWWFSRLLLPNLSSAWVPFLCRYTYPLQFKNCWLTICLINCVSCCCTEWFGVNFRLMGHFSASASPSCASLPSAGITAYLLPGTVWCLPVSPFGLGRPESLTWTFFDVCQELAVALSSQGALPVVDHCCSPPSTSLCMLRKVGTEQHGRLEVLLCFWLSLTTNSLYTELVFSRLYKTKAGPRYRHYRYEGKGATDLFWSC